MNQNNTPTSEERARDIIKDIVFEDTAGQWVWQIKKGYEFELVDKLAKALDAQRKEVARECAEIADKTVREVPFRKACEEFWHNEGRNWASREIAKTIKEKFDV